MKKVFWEDPYQTVLHTTVSEYTDNKHLPTRPIISPLQHNKKHTLIMCVSFFIDSIPAVDFDWLFCRERLSWNRI